MPLQPCNAKSDLSASRYSSWWAMRRGGLSTDKVRSKSCLQERSASPRNALDCVYTAELNLSRWVQGQHTRSELARDMDVNDNALFLNKRVALESIASKLAPTKTSFP